MARRSSLSAKTESDAYVYLLAVFGSERVGKVQSSVNGIVRRLAILAPLQLSDGSSSASIDARTLDLYRHALHAVGHQFVSHRAVTTRLAVALQGGTQQQMDTS